MKKSAGFLILIIITLILLSACKSTVVEEEKNTQENKTQIANPASEFCVSKGFENTIVTNPDGSQTGYCLVQTEKGTVECDEWQFFRGECPKAENKTAEVTKAETDTAAPSEKFLVNFPWSEGEAWTLTTNFHDENCLDFVNFASTNDKVVAAADGEVMLSTYDYPDSFNTYSTVETDNPEDMGNYIVLKHNSNTYTIYFHLQHEETPPVKNGDQIKAGTFLGLEGNTGFSHGKHLHFCVVDVSLFPPGFITKPLDSWGFAELDGSNKLELNKKYAR